MNKKDIDALLDKKTKCITVEPSKCRYCAEQFYIWEDFEHWNPEDGYIEIAANYCPFCGRKLKGGE